MQLHTSITSNIVNSATRNDDITSSNSGSADLKNHGNFEIKYAPRDKGRHVIARNDITEGEIVSVEPVPLLMLLFDPQEAQWSRLSKKYY